MGLGLAIYCSNLIFLFHKCHRSANADILTTFIIKRSRKPLSLYSSCDTTVHNLTAANKQMPLEFGNHNFRVQFLFRQNANADIMTTF